MHDHYIVYLDEFGHGGPYVSRTDARYKTSPVFGLAGFALPARRVRDFAVWFFQMKGRLLAFEIDRSGKHPAKWEKKGSSLYTINNIEMYHELRQSTNRLLNKIRNMDGFIIYDGIQKYADPTQHDEKSLYKTRLSKVIKSLDFLFSRKNATFLIMLDQHEIRAELVEAASKTMFGATPAHFLVEPPVQVESHLYQTIQCADWICGLMGRLGAYRIRPDEYFDFEPVERYFGARIDAVAAHARIKRTNGNKTGDSGMGPK